MTIQTFPVAAPSFLTTAITTTYRGQLWFTATDSAATSPTPSGVIGTIDPTTKAITVYPIPFAGSAPAGIAEGADGFLWFTDPGTNSIGQFDPTNHNFAEYPISTAGSGPAGITPGPDGNLWFTENKAGQVGTISPVTHAIAEFPVAGAGYAPEGIVAGPGGDLWFIEAGPSSVVPFAPAIGTIDPTTHAVASFPLSMPNVTPWPGIAVAPDGDLFFGTYNFIGRGATASLLHEMDPTTHAVASYPGAPVYGAAIGPDGDIFIAAETEIDAFDPATKALTSSAFVLAGFGSSGQSITRGPDGNLWFVSANAIGEASPIPSDQATVVGNVSLGQGNSPPAAPGRTVYVDLNGDGTLDPGDPTAVTDANGQFTINGIPPGSSTLRVVDFPGDFSTTASVTLAGGQLLLNQQLNVQPTTAILPLTYTAFPFGPIGNVDATTAEVTALYNIVLGRAPDQPGLEGWVNLIQSGTPYAQVASAFLHGTPYYDRVITTDYQTFAGRAPTPDEQAVWVGLLQSGISEEQVADLMLISPGFNALHPDDGSFVQALYNDVLGRQASDAELAAWDSYLSGSSRSNVVALFLRSEGAAQRAVDGFYAIALGRAPDQAGEAFYIAALEGTATLSDVALDFLTSTEFVQLASQSVKP